MVKALVAASTTTKNLVARSSISLKIPVPKKTTNTVKNDKAVAEHDDFCKAIDLMVACPQFRTPALRKLRDLYIQEQTGKAYEQHDCFDSVTTLKALDEGYVCVYLGKKLGVQPSLVAKSKTGSGADTPYLLMAWLLNASVTQPLASGMIVKGVCTDVLDLRVQEAGDRHKLSETPMIDAAGKVDWGLGTYEPTWDQGTKFLLELTHRPTGHSVTIDPVYNITKEWSLVNNHSDSVAEFKRTNKLRHRCATFFQKGEGPNKVPMLTPKSMVLSNSCDAVWRGKKTVMETEAAKVPGKDESVEKELAKVTKANKAKAIEKARVALQNRHVEIERQHTLKYQRSDPKSPGRKLTVEAPK